MFVTVGASAQNFGLGGRVGSGKGNWSLDAGAGVNVGGGAHWANCGISCVYYF